MVNDLLQVGNIYPVAFARAHRDMEGNICMQLLERLDEDGCGCLPISIEITPNADGGVVEDGCFQAIYDGGEPGQVCRWAGGVG